MGEVMARGARGGGSIAELHSNLIVFDKEVQEKNFFHFKNLQV